MRNIAFYQERLSNASSLSEVEKYLSGSLKQVKVDRKTLVDRRHRLLDSIKNIDEDLKKIKGIERTLTQLSQKKVNEIVIELSK